MVEFGIAVANSRVPGLAREIERFASSTDIGGIRLETQHRAGISAAVFDYRVALDTAAGITSLIQFLWFIYERFIAPARAKGDSVDLYVAVLAPDRKDFWMSQTFSKRAEFGAQLKRLLDAKTKRRRSLPGDRRRK
jgi:hypothetical protein